LILPRTLYQLATSCCRATAFSGGPTSKISTWEHGDGPSKGLDFPGIKDTLAGPNQNLLGNGQNEVGRPHREVGRVDTVTFPCCNATRHIITTSQVRGFFASTCADGEGNFGKRARNRTIIMTES
jgi:hypothetical protein